MCWFQRTLREQNSFLALFSHKHRQRVGLSLSEEHWFSTDKPGSGYLLSGDTGGWQLGYEGKKVSQAPTRPMAPLPVGLQLLTSQRDRIGHARAMRCRNCKRHTGSRGVQLWAVSVHWVLLIPCPLSMFHHPPTLFFVCLCVNYPTVLGWRF